MDEQTNLKKKTNKKQMIIIAVVAIVIIVGIYGLIFGVGTNNFDTPQNPNNDPSQNPNNNPSVSNIYHKMGESALYEGLSITIKDFSFQNNFAGVTPDSNTNNTLLVVNVSVTNTTNHTINLYKSIITYQEYLCEYDLCYNNSVTYYERWANYTDFLRVHESINALSTINAAMCFQVPPVVKESGKLEIKLYNGKKDATLFHIWTLRSESESKV